MKMHVLLLAGFVLALPCAVANAEHAIEPETAQTETLPTTTRETCTTTFWLADEVRQVCVTKAVAPRAANPALNGICVTSYGRRTCY